MREKLTTRYTCRHAMVGTMCSDCIGKLIEEEMRERIESIKNVLETGLVVEKPNRKEDYDRWKFKVATLIEFKKAMIKYLDTPTNQDNPLTSNDTK